MNIAIIEDNDLHKTELYKIIYNWTLINDIKCDIREYSEGEVFLKNLLNIKFDLIFVDIRMPKLNGMDLVKILREKEIKSLVVFVTGETSFVFQGYKVSALDYILKPIKESDVFNALSRAKSLLEDTNKFIYIEDSSKLIKINVENIIYTEVRDKFLNIKVKNDDGLINDIVIRSSLDGFIKKVEEIGEDNRFGMPHRSFYCNLKMINKIFKNDIVYKDIGNIPISRGKKEAFLSKYFTYLRSYSNA